VTNSALFIFEGFSAVTSQVNRTVCVVYSAI